MSDGKIYFKAQGLKVGDKVRVDGKKDYEVTAEVQLNEFELTPVPTLGQKIKRFFGGTKVRKTKDGREYHPTKGFR